MGCHTWFSRPITEEEFELMKQYAPIEIYNLVGDSEKNIEIGGDSLIYIENIVIGKPIVTPQEMFALNENDWLRIEQEKTYYTSERFLPRILVELGIYPSISEIRRNKPNLMVSLDNVDFIDNLKVSKKRRLWILVGE